MFFRSPCVLHSWGTPGPKEVDPDGHDHHEYWCSAPDHFVWSRTDVRWTGCCRVRRLCYFCLIRDNLVDFHFSIGNGINTSTAPIWQTETAPPQWRRKLVLVEMVMNIFGSALVNWINYGLSFYGGAIAWRFPLAFQFFFIIILFSTVPWLPESPRLVAPSVMNFLGCLGLTMK